MPLYWSVNFLPQGYFVSRLNKISRMILERKMNMWFLFSKTETDRQQMIKKLRLAQVSWEKKPEKYEKCRDRILRRGDCACVPVFMLFYQWNLNHSIEWLILCCLKSRLKIFYSYPRAAIFKSILGAYGL